MYYLGMRKARKTLRIIGLVFLVFWLGSCATTEPTAPPQPEQPDSELPEDESPELPAEPDAEEEQDNETEEPPAENDELSDDDIYIETEEFVISNEMYETTFNEVEAIIEELNEIIADRDFEQWKAYLTDDYLEFHSDPAVLRERSESPVLSRNNIELNSLEDYFTWVVVPSRANARLDDLDFIGTDKVEAIMRVRDQGVILYQLKRVNDRWKIDVF